MRKQRASNTNAWPALYTKKPGPDLFLYLFQEDDVNCTFFVNVILIVESVKMDKDVKWSVCRRVLEFYGRVKYEGKEEVRNQELVL